MSALSLLYLGTLLCWQIVSICPYDTDEWERSQARERARVLSTTEATWRREPGTSIKTVYMDEHCRLVLHDFVLDDARVYVDHSMYVELTAHPESRSYLQCLVSFSTRDPDWRLLLHFEKLNVNFNPGTVDRFRIFDGASEARELTPARGLFGNYAKGKRNFSSGSVQDYVSSGQALTLYFIGNPSRLFTGFRILLTVFKDPDPSSRYSYGRCDEGYFHCKTNDYCVNDVLMCDGIQNCGQGDKSDEEYCPHKFDPHAGGDTHMLEGPLDLGLLVGCALSIVILVIVVIWMTVVFVKKRRFGRSRRRYARHEGSSEDDAPPPPDPSIVEPAQIHRVMTPSVGFMEPPPLYSVRDVGVSSAGVPSGMLEMPPPYTPVDERDTAGLLLNESAVNPPGGAAAQDASSAARLRSCTPVSLPRVVQQPPPPPPPPPPPHSELRPLTGITRQTEADALPALEEDGNGEFDASAVMNTPCSGDQQTSSTQTEESGSKNLGDIATLDKTDDDVPAFYVQM